MEKKRRSFAKAATWRVLATTDTVILSLIFTGSVRAALSIGGLELLTKIVWYYAHERLWNNKGLEHRPHSRLDKLFGRGARMRSFVKAVSWRFFGAVDTFVISLFVTGKLAISGSIGGTEFITKIVLYYLHERLWMHIWWGIPSSHDKDTESQSRLTDFLRVLSHYYHIIAAAFYAIWCVLFILISAYIVYGIHTLLI